MIQQVTCEASSLKVANQPSLGPDSFPGLLRFSQRCPLLASFSEKNLPRALEAWLVGPGNKTTL